MAASFGIHFGSTSACIASCRDGKVDVVANDAGDRVTPAVVAFTDLDETVGLSAKQGLARNSSNTVCHVKQVIGRNFDDSSVQTFINNNAVKVINKDGKPVFEVEHKEKRKCVTPVEIVSKIYKKMMETAESHGGAADSHDAVVTVPLGFSPEQNEAIRDAATRAGFIILRIISEPCAALLAYDLGQNQRESGTNLNVLVYRLGGTSLDLTVVSSSNGMYRVLGSLKDDQVGGHMIEDIMIDHFAGEFKRQWKYDCKENKRSVAKLRNAAENCKRVLSKMNSAQCSVESLFEGIDFQSTMTRARFDGLCGSFVQKCLKPMQDILDLVDLKKEDIHKVIICGGTTKVPCLQKQLMEYFPQAELLSSVSPDEVLAAGAAKQAAILSGLEADELVQNELETEVSCLPVDIVIQVGAQSDKRYATILEKFTPVPVKRQLTFTVNPEQSSFLLHFMQRDQNDSEPQTLGRIVMRELSNPNQVTTSFHAKSDGSVHVSCTDVASGNTESVIVTCSS